MDIIIIMYSQSPVLNCSIASDINMTAAIQEKKNATPWLMAFQISSNMKLPDVLRVV
jgi:hypothetical protein